eukprot:scaffold486_cov148-Skeletonema_dohrnii-CCMP3373.AAC.16
MDMLGEKIFEQCPNCKQSLQGDIYYDMTKAQLTFIEREFKGVDDWHLGALMKRIMVLDGKKDADRIEGEEICAKMLKLIDDMNMKKNCLPSDIMVLASIYQGIGKFNVTVGTKRSVQKAMHYLKQGRDIVEASGDRELLSLVDSIENTIALVEEMITGACSQNRA